MLFRFKLSERETTMGPHIPIQCPRPTVTPVVKKRRNSASVDDIEDKVNFPNTWNRHRCSPGAFAAGTPDYDSRSLIDAGLLGFQNNLIGSHVHSRHPQIDEGWGARMLPVEGYHEGEVFHCCNRFGDDVESDFAARYRLSARTLMEVARYCCPQIVLRCINRISKNSCIE